MKTNIIRVTSALLALLLLLSCTACSGAKRKSGEIIEDMVVYYGKYTDEADANVAKLLEELSDADPDAGARWTQIMALWKDCNSRLDLNYDVLPDGLPDDSSLCLVALGFQLNPDGSMKDELVERLKVLLASAEKYPEALVVCTGGGTAAEDETATEAGKMAEWLIGNGIDEKRIIVEDKSVTTAQNAIFTFDILEKEHPEVTQLVIISSDYHIATGTLLFEAEAILRAKQADGDRLDVISNAAYKAPSGSLSTMFQAGALIELAGDKKTAFEIYYDTYDIHELPKID